MRVDSGWEAAVGLVVGSVAAVLGRLVACRVESLFLLACCISMGVTPNALGIPAQFVSRGRLIATDPSLRRPSPMLYFRGSRDRLALQAAPQPALVYS